MSCLFANSLKDMTKEWCIFSKIRIWTVSEKESELKNLRESNREQLSEVGREVTRLRVREQELQVRVVT
jgi:hypothetical protein